MARESSSRDRVPPLEWAASALGLFVVAVLLFFIARDIGEGSGDGVPLLSARIEAVTAISTGHVAQIVVANRSSQTAAAVQLEGKLGDEVASASIDYVPGHSEARGGLLFRGDPRTGAVELRVTGYELP